MKFDTLSLMRNKKPIILGKLSLLQPSLGDIEDIGYETYQDYLFTIISNSKDIADILWVKQKIWYEDIQNEWLFFVEKSIYNFKVINVCINEVSINTVEAIAISDEYRDALNFFLKTTGEYIVIDKNSEKKETYLCNVQKIDNTDVYLLNNNNFKLTESFYVILVQYLKKINWINITYDFTKGGTKKAKKFILEQKYKERKNKKKENITLSSIVSSLIERSQPYKDIWDYPIYFIYELYYRTIHDDDYKNTMQALHSGCIDTKKNPIDWEKINWSKVID